MKKITFAIFAALFIGSLCFAQEQPEKNNQTVESSAEIKTFTGTVEKITLADFMKGTRTESILVINDKGESKGFIMQAGVIIKDRSGKMMSLDGIEKNDKVTVEYRQTRSGIIKLKSIEVIE